jgi:hypothetical protein
MNLISAAAFRRVIPAGAVFAVLAFSYLSPLPTAASNLNNCGVKGYGYHDHGKPCPNRPFPGKGRGVTKLLISGAAANLSTRSSGSSEVSDNPPEPMHTVRLTETSARDVHKPAVSKSHGRGGGTAWSKDKL